MCSSASSSVGSALLASVTSNAIPKELLAAAPSGAFARIQADIDKGRPDAPKYILDDLRDLSRYAIVANHLLADAASFTKKALKKYNAWTFRALTEQWDQEGVKYLIEGLERLEAKYNMSFEEANILVGAE